MEEGEAIPVAAGGQAPPVFVERDTDVARILDNKQIGATDKLDWRNSIVDLLKLLGMDSSLTHRKQLAMELGFQGDTNHPTEMNVFLHREVMKQLAQNGGQVPSNLL